MSRHGGHYEPALADYLRSQGVPFVGVDEARRSIFHGAKIKSFDFLVYPPNGRTWLVDVKGRKFPYASNGARRYWENWVTQADLDGLRQWEAVFGSGFEGLFVFAYQLSGDPARWPTLSIHPFEGQHYAFYGISQATYRQHCRQRSERWKTVSLPTPLFRQLAVPIARHLESA